jgi:hypothetical protein
MLSSLVVHGDLNLVGLVNGEIVHFVDPFVVPRWLRASLDRILDLYVNERLWSSTKTTGGCVVNVGNCLDTKREGSAQWLSLAGDVQAVVYAGISCVGGMFQSDLPSPPSPTMSTCRSS